MHLRTFGLLALLVPFSVPSMPHAQNGIGHVNGCQRYMPSKVGQGPGDQFGRSVAHLRDPYTGLAGDVDGDGIDDMVVGAQGDKAGTGTAGHGAAYLLLLDADGDIKKVGNVWQKFRISEDTLTSVPSNHSSGFGIDLDADDHFGKAAVGVGDLDGNGVPDVAVGAPFDRNDVAGLPKSGAVYFLFLQDPTTNSGQPVKSIYKMGGAELQAGTPSLTIDNKEEFGRALVFLGDFQGDGAGHFTMVVGASGDCDGCVSVSEVGALYMMQLEYNSTTGGIDYVHSNKIDRSQGIIGGGGVSPAPNNLRLGTSCAYLGEVGGYHYFAAGSNWALAGPAIPGGMFVFKMDVLTPQGSSNWELQVDSYDFYKGYKDDLGQIISCTPPGNPFCAEGDEGDVFAYSVCGIGDWDHNGFPDVAIGLLADEDPCNGVVNVGGVYVALLAEGTSGRTVDVVAKQKISLCDGSLMSECSVVGPLHSGAKWASSLTWMECHDGSGSGALAVGARFGGGLGTNRGVVTLLYLERTQLGVTTSDNGTGKNPTWLVGVKPAVIGKDIIARVVPTGGATVASSLLTLHPYPHATEPCFATGQLLVDNSVTWASSFVPAGSDHVIPIPFDLAALTAPVYVQAVAFDGMGGQQLTNRLDLATGDFRDPN